MIICHCFATTDRDLRQAAEKGSSSCREVVQSCRAGTNCKGCIPAIVAFLKGLEDEGGAAHHGQE